MKSFQINMKTPLTVTETSFLTPLIKEVHDLEVVLKFRQDTLCKITRLLCEQKQLKGNFSLNTDTWSLDSIEVIDGQQGSDATYAH